MSPEEVAAVTAVAIVVERLRAVPPPRVEPEHLSMWVEASRRSAQRALLQRGPWRLSGRIGRRPRT
jgi:hypothetical protein